MSFDAFFLPADDGQRFCIYHPAQVKPGSLSRGDVVYVHPFAEEMNKSRRMAAMQARALAHAGFDVLQIDLLGCGDSSGDFGDATWEAWVQDVVRACHWLRARAEGRPQHTPQPPLWLWGLRAGCLLAVQAAQSLQQPSNFLFWAPTPAGKPLLQQFLRLKAAQDMASGNAKAVMEGLRTDITQGRPVEIAGYLLDANLATGIEQAILTPPGTGPANCRVEWFELSTRDDASLTPVVGQSIAQWQQAGYTVHSHIATGPSFWQTSEIEDVPALIEATTAAILAISKP
jgi:exosortase A-associated hydrolase 2